jgi:hypothetical protein
MNRNDKKYQDAVDKATKELSLKTIDELISMPDYGNIDNQDDVAIGYWKWNKAGEIVHIHILAERSVFPFPRLYRKYHGGIAIENETKRLLTDEELGQYD